ncbi:tail fiber assembly protein [Morganella sp. B601]|uniref:tail fiber assembly protein n=1 Tax=Morganella sp. B601 TaxID=3444315 RepID=UPI003EBB3652
MKFGFSAKESQFFIMDKKDDYEKNGIWPDDIVVVDGDVMHKYSGIPPEGKLLGSDKKGNPAWVDIPPLTHEQHVAIAESQKQVLIAEVHTDTEMLRTKLALKRIKPDEEALLIAWLDYLDLLEAVDTSTAPIIDWPQKPI